MTYLFEVRLHFDATCIFRLKCLQNYQIMSRHVYCTHFRRCLNWLEPSLEMNSWIRLLLLTMSNYVGRVISALKAYVQNRVLVTTCFRSRGFNQKQKHATRDLSKTHNDGVNFYSWTYFEFSEKKFRWYYSRSIRHWWQRPYSRVLSIVDRRDGIWFRVRSMGRARLDCRAHHAIVCSPLTSCRRWRVQWWWPRSCACLRPMLNNTKIHN